MNKLLAVALVGVSVVAVAASAFAWLESPVSERDVRADAGLPLSGSLNPVEADAAVRGYIHRTNIVGSSVMNSAQQVYADLGENAQLCGGMAWAHAWAMQQLGIEARYVTLGGQDFIDGTDRFQTHAVAEVFYDGDWHISDPTFDMHVDCSDGENRLSVKGAFACLARGESLVGVEGASVVPEKSLAQFAGRYEDYFAGYELGDYTTGREAYPEAGWIDAALAQYGIERR